MSLIEITPQELRKKAKELERLREQDDAIMRRMRTLVMGLAGEWQGQAQAAYINQFNENQKRMADFSDTIQKYATLAKTAADELEAMDRELLAEVNKIG